MKSEDYYEIEFDPIADALAAIRNGECVVVVDDEKRENEGDLIIPASKCNSKSINMYHNHRRTLLSIDIYKQDNIFSIHTITTF